MDDNGHVQPYVEILEQPATRAIRFLYESESKKNLILPGANSTIQNKSYPAIRIVGKKGPARVVISCVTKEPPYRPHPYSVQNKQECYNGVSVIEIPEAITVVTFPDLSIQCVRKSNTEQVLKMRQDLQMDPFKTGFSHATNQIEIGFTALRLCFQVFLEGSRKDKFNVALPPIVSDPIYDRRAMPDLVIREVCEHSAPVAGGKKMILLCEKIVKEDIQIRFFEQKNGQLLWEGYGDFQPVHVHKRTAISFKTPRYYKQEVEEPVQVFIELRRSVDGFTSEPVPFQMLPIGADDASSLKRKRRKLNNDQQSILASLSKYIRFEKPVTLENDIERTCAERPNAHEEDFTQYIKSYSQGQNNAQIQRSQMPGQMPLGIKYNNYNLPPQQYGQNVQPIMQQSNMSAAMSTCPSSCTRNQSQLHQAQIKCFQQEPNLLLSERLTPEGQEGLSPMNSIQNQSSEVSPEQISSIIEEYNTYNLLQQQYGQNIQPMTQQPNMSVTMDPSSYVSSQSQFDQSEANIFEPEIDIIISERMSENQEELQLINNTQKQSPQVTPKQIPSCMEHTSIHNTSFTQQQYQPSPKAIMQQSNMSAIRDVQPPSYMQPDQSQLFQPGQNLNKEPSESQGELQPVNNTSAECLLNTDTKQIDFYSNYSDISPMNSGRNLSKSLSGLSISDAHIDTR